MFFACGIVLSDGYQGLLEAPYLNPVNFVNNLCANVSCLSPLQQYRHRDFIRQSVSLYQKACRSINVVPLGNKCLDRCSTPILVELPYSFSPFSPLSPMKEPSGRHSYSCCNDDDERMDSFSSHELPAIRKPSPSSPLFLWRQKKIRQAALNGNLQESIFPEQSSNGHRTPIPPGLAIYRGRRNADASGPLPLNLCDSLEKLFRAHSENSNQADKIIATSSYTRKCKNNADLSSDEKPQYL